MNYATLHGVQVQPNSHGPTAIDNRAISFWQSRMTTTGGGLASLPSLSNIRAIAEAVRTSWPTEE